MTNFIIIHKINNVFANFNILAKWAIRIGWSFERAGTAFFWYGYRILQKLFLFSASENSQFIKFWCTAWWRVIAYSYCTKNVRADYQSTKLLTNEDFNIKRGVPRAGALKWNVHSNVLLTIATNSAKALLLRSVNITARWLLGSKYLEMCFWPLILYLGQTKLSYCTLYEKSALRVCIKFAHHFYVMKVGCIFTLFFTKAIFLPFKCDDLHCGYLKLHSSW